MRVAPRSIGAALAGLAAAAALAAPLAGQAEAATSTVVIKNDATGSQTLSVLDGFIAHMANSTTMWTRTDVAGAPGYATYSRRVGNKDLCLTGRPSTAGANILTTETCVAGFTKQQWRHGVARDLQLRLNGLSAEVDLANANRVARMGFFSGKPHQKWTIQKV
jgi:hypothetical protein